ncbi:GILT-like protein F37H8.5 [Aphelenchoides besseyi]|nr:GILT-like protein F37H8.5 [Aphelenchoides besseyi]
MLLFSVLSLLFVLSHEYEMVADVPKNIDCSQLPPALWCKNEELAAKCEVQDACKKYREGSKGKKLLLTVLYESLCPDCQEFITGDLYNKVYSKFQKYVDIELIPYGNAKRHEDGTITCQHGDNECKINKHEDCALHFLHPNDRIPYIYCLELKLKQGTDFEKASKACFTKLDVGPHIYDLIHHCELGKKGQKLQLVSADRTENIFPDKHQFVPHLLFQNVSLMDAQGLIRDLPLTLCGWIEGEKPDVCGGIGSRESMRSH